MVLVFRIKTIEISIELMNVKMVDMMILLSFGSVCVGVKSSMNVKFLSQTGVLWQTYSKLFCIF